MAPCVMVSESRSVGEFHFAANKEELQSLCLVKEGERNRFSLRPLFSCVCTARAAGMLRLHLEQVHDVADGDEEQESLFPHTPRLDDRCFEPAVPETLVLQCMRPGSCGVANGTADREWLHRRCVGLGHASNERKELLMAHSWFQCAYACKGGMTELLSSTNMRLNLGQWHLCDKLYANILGVELSEEQRALTERKHAEVHTRLGAAGSHAPGARLTAAEELEELLAAPGANAQALPAEEEKRLLGLLRVCGHAANKAGDYEAAHVWFDCAFALCGAPPDLLSGANMRCKLVPTSAVAMAAYRHVLALVDEPGKKPPEKQLKMAADKLKLIEGARGLIDQRATGGFVQYPGGESFREYF